MYGIKVTCPGFLGMKFLGVPFLGMFVPLRVSPLHLIRFLRLFTSTHLYSWVERGTLHVKSLGHEHNTVTWSGLEPTPLDSEFSTLTLKPLHFLLYLLKQNTVEPLLGSNLLGGYPVLCGQFSKSKIFPP